MVCRNIKIKCGQPSHKIIRYTKYKPDFYILQDYAALYEANISYVASVEQLGGPMSQVLLSFPLMFY